MRKASPIYTQILLALLFVGSACSPEKPGWTSAWAESRICGLHYMDGGAKDARIVLVFLNGWASDRRIWEASFLRHFDGMRKLIIEIPGHGKSPELEESRYTMDNCARAVFDVLDQAHVDQAILVGHALGATIARQCWRQKPERVRGIVVVDGSLKLLVPEKFTEDEVIRQLRFPKFEEFRHIFMDLNLVPVPQRHMDRARAMMQDASRSGMLGLILASLAPEIWTDDRIEVPVFCAMAEHPFWDDEHQAYVRNLVPKLRWKIYEGTGHFVQLDIPDKLGRDIEDFVTSLFDV